MSSEEDHQTIPASSSSKTDDTEDNHQLAAEVIGESNNIYPKLPAPSSVVEETSSSAEAANDETEKTTDSKTTSVSKKSLTNETIDKAANGNGSRVVVDESSYWPTRAERVEDLNPAEVRWFYQESTTAPFQPFCGNDSLRIEVMYRVINKLDMPSRCREVVGTITQDNNAVPVLGGLYQLNSEKWIIEPIYWEGDSKAIIRGTWFKDMGSGKMMEPIAVANAATLETQHMRTFAGQSTRAHSMFSSSKEKRPVLVTVETPEYKVEWNSCVDIRMIMKKRFSIRSTIFDLKRGYPEVAQLNDKPKPIGHLVFVVHGIGHASHKNLLVEQTDKLRREMDNLMGDYLKDAPTRPLLIPVLWRKDLVLDGGVVECITLPEVVSLRRALNESFLDVLYYISPEFNAEIQEGLTKNINRLYKKFIDCNPDFERNNGKISMYSHSLGSVISYDIINGWSPSILNNREERRGGEQQVMIGTQTSTTGSLASVSSSSTALVKPGGGVPCATIAEGKHETAGADTVSIASSNTSAGSRKEALQTEISVLKRRFVAVPCTPSLSELTTEYVDEEEKDKSRLKFHVDNLFCVGSPLGVFLALRAAQIVQTSRSCGKIYNIFHPTDPVAYRIEPLIHPNYQWIRPLKISHYHKILKDVKYEERPPTLIPQRQRKEKMASIDAVLEEAHEVTEDSTPPQQQEEKEGKKKTLSDSSGEAASSRSRNEDHRKSVSSKIREALSNAGASVSSPTSDTPDGCDPEEDDSEDDDDDDDDDEDGKDGGGGDGASGKNNDVKEAPIKKSKGWFSWATGGGHSKKGGHDSAAASAESVAPAKPLTPVETLLKQIEQQSVSGVLDRRLDYTIRQGRTELNDLYNAVFYSHFVYWNCNDVIMFVLGEIYRDTIEKTKEEKRKK